MSSIPCIDLTSPEVPRSVAPVMAHDRLRRSEVVESLKQIGKALGMENASEKAVLKATLSYVELAKIDERKSELGREILELELRIATMKMKKLEEQLAAAQSRMTVEKEVEEKEKEVEVITID